MILKFKKKYCQNRREKLHRTMYFSADSEFHATTLFWRTPCFALTHPALPDKTAKLTGPEVMLYLCRYGLVIWQQRFGDWRFLRPFKLVGYLLRTFLLFFLLHSNFLKKNVTRAWISCFTTKDKFSFSLTPQHFFFAILLVL